MQNSVNFREHKTHMKYAPYENFLRCGKSKAACAPCLILNEEGIFFTIDFHPGARFAYAESKCKWRVWKLETEMKTEAGNGK